MAIEGLQSHEVVPKPLWNTPLPASQTQAEEKSFQKHVYRANYDERIEVLPKEKAEYTEKDVVLGTKAGEEAKDELSFWDFVDIINPLQHIPLVGSLYRYVTGDEITGAARVAGGGIYGGPMGLAFGAVNAVIAQNEGNDIGGIFLTKTFGPSTHDIDSGKADIAVQVANLDEGINMTPIKTSRFAHENSISKTKTAENYSKIPEDTEKSKEKSYIVAQNNTKPSENSEWQAYYTHQLKLESKNLDDYQNSLADDTYERQLLIQAEQEAVAQQNKVRMERESKSNERLESIGRMKNFEAEEAAKREEVIKNYVRTNEYGLRESAGMYPTISP